MRQCRKTSLKTTPSTRWCLQGHGVTGLRSVRLLGCEALWQTHKGRLFLDQLRRTTVKACQCWSTSWPPTGRVRDWQIPRYVRLTLGTSPGAWSTCLKTSSFVKTIAAPDAV